MAESIRQAVATDTAPQAIGPYSQAVRAGGLLFVSGQVPIDPATGALIEGDIETREAVVAGEVAGSIRADERVELQATALVRGDITTPKIAILEGGKVTGAVNMTDTPTLSFEPEEAAPGEE